MKSRKYEFSITLKWDNLKGVVGEFYFDKNFDLNNKRHNEMAELLKSLAYRDENFYKLLRLSLSKIDKEQEELIKKRKCFYRY